MSITHLTSIAQLNDILARSKDKLTVIDFHATWCGPCRTIAPTFEALAKQYSSSNFLKCDVDAAKEVASEYGVSAMPTFVFLKGSNKVDQVKGANRVALEDAVRRHASPVTSAFSGKGHTLGGSPAPVQIGREVQAQAGSLTTMFSKLDPQLKILLGLVAAYLAFWFLG